jgi:2-polyprenyl-3-methyl-5-hydroxy-6-metoxy-1,4-benzoquinol methylase
MAYEEEFPGTESVAYTERLVSLSDRRWKQVIDTQRPYRWNLKRLNLGRTLDIGCGVGRNLSSLGADSVGIDHNDSSIEVARARGLAAWTVKDWTDSGQAVAESFDSILLAHVLEHMSAGEAQDLIEKYRPLLRTAGRIVVVCPQELGYATDATHVRYLDATDIVAHVEEGGFAVERNYSFPFPRKFGRAFPYNEFVVVGCLRPDRGRTASQ